MSERQGTVGSTRRRALALVCTLAAFATLAAGCGGGANAAEPQTRRVLVDYNTDEFASSLLEYYPRVVQVRPGDTVEFEQKWTGEPHSVTMGSYIDKEMQPILELLAEIRRTGDIPEDEPEEFENFAVPYAWGEDNFAQNAAQPCYVLEADFDGEFPGDETTPCETREQPEFSNDYAIYNSGIIPYEGVKGNSFTVKLADDLKPGKYAFYCNVHGPLQHGQLDVQAKGTEIPSAGEVAKQARDEANVIVEPLSDAYQTALKGGTLQGGDMGEIEVEAKGKNLVGVPTPFIKDGEILHGFINEFVPRDVAAKVNEKVTWTFESGHTLSFNVPRYFPIFTVADDGTITFNKQAEEPVGGWPDRPPPENEEEWPPPPVDIDVGKWDGKGFKSTGLNYSLGDTFSITFTRPGTYTYACLIHPEMVGKVVVKA